MACSKYFFIVLVVLLDQMFSKVSTSQCESQYSIYGKMLKGHVFKTIRTSMSLECLNACNEDPRCQSFNYVMVQNIFELNSFTKEAGPQYFVTSTDRYYITVKGMNKISARPGISVFLTKSKMRMHAVDVLDKFFAAWTP